MSEVRKIASFDVDIDVPNFPRHSERVPKLFNEAWGYVDGVVNREPAYESEPAEYDLGKGSLVPIKWPEPEGFQDATRRLHGGQKQRVTVEIYSNGERRIVTKES